MNIDIHIENWPEQITREETRETDTHTRYNHPDEIWGDAGYV